jgi:hypothetical protein
VIVIGGRRRNQEIEVPAGVRFAMFPLDAEVRLMFGGLQSGPFAAAGGRLPLDDDPALRWIGPALGSEAAELSEEERERLRALGYVN